MSANLGTALEIGVLGLNAKASAISMISDNVMNVNTVGYKNVDSQFSSIYQAQSSNGNMLSGGVTSVPLQSVATQGLLRPDNGYASMAVSGSGMFVASKTPEVIGDFSYVYTRAGQFSMDADGNLKNIGGHYLQGWPYDLQTETLPGTAEERETNFNLLETINLSNLSGAAKATENVEIRLNLDASQGTQSTIGFYENGEAIINKQMSADDVLFTQADQTLTSVSFVNADLNVGDKLTVTNSTLNAQEYTITAFDKTTGVITVAEPVVDETLVGTGTVDIIDSTAKAQGTLLSAPNGVTFDTAGPHVVAADLIGADIQVDDFVVVRGPYGGRDNDGTYQVSAFDSVTGSITFTQPPALAATVASADFDVLSPDNPVFFQDEIQASVTSTLFNAAGSSIQSAALIGKTFAAGDQIEIKTATGTNDGIWSVTSYDAVTGALKLQSLDGVQTIATEDLASADMTMFRQISEKSGLGSATEPTLTASQVAEYRSVAGEDLTPDFMRGISIYDGQGVEHDFTVSFMKSSTPNKWYVEISSRSAYTGTGGDDTHYPNGLISFGSVEFTMDGRLDTQASTMYVPTYTAGAVPPVSYNKSTLADAQGYDIIWDPATTGASGSVSTGLLPQRLEKIDLGDHNDTNGLSQFSGTSVMYSNDVDGAIFGRFTDIQVDAEGWMYANYNNGLSQKIYKLPLAEVPNPSGLSAVTGNAYVMSDTSGPVTLKDGSDRKAEFSFRTLEQSTVNLADEFTEMIVIQRAYSAASKLITTADEMLQEAARLK